jgi:hypothetical protein
MAIIRLNYGNIQDLVINKEHKNTKFYLTVKSEIASNDVILAGITGIGLFTYRSHNLNLNDEILGYGFELDNKVLEVTVRPTKFPGKKNEIEVSNYPVQCILTIEAGDILIEKFILSDEQNLSINPVFEFKIRFLF